MVEARAFVDIAAIAQTASSLGFPCVGVYVLSGGCNSQVLLRYRRAVALLRGSIHGHACVAAEVGWTWSCVARVAIVAWG